MQLGFNITFDDLYRHGCEVKLDAAFIDFLNAQYPTLYEIYHSKDGLKGQRQIADYIFTLAAPFEHFISELFGVSASLKKHKDLATEYKRIAEFKKTFIQRKAAKTLVTAKSASIVAVHNTLDPRTLVPLLISMIEDGREEEALTYCHWKIHNDPIPALLFKLPHKVDPQNLLAIDYIDDKREIPTAMLDAHARIGFEHTGKKVTYDEMKAEAAYCLYCHERNKDSCSQGLQTDNGEYQKNELGNTLKGCPLEEKISEMNFLVERGEMVAALATAIIDNPMLAATGHRICNDCMKSCIFQKQEPVNVPQIESGVLQEVLQLNYGFEIYSLLTRWNPLNPHANYAAPKNRNETIMVAGLGPAGFTLAHYLLNEGFGVVGIDGLKIDPLPSSLAEFTPIKRIEDIWQNLSERNVKGFGGVAEYGITSRWDKNYLTVVRLLLERRSKFRMYGGVRFGSNLTFTDLKNLGISHLSLCLGAGSPNLLPIPNIMARGVRTASDFLMSLNLGAAHDQRSATNIEMQMPVVVIGGGLTAIDAATEALEYYVAQCKNYHRAYEQLGHSIFQNLNAAEQDKLKDFIAHGELFINEPDRKIHHLRDLGGVTICYRKNLEESTAYRLNHEEVGFAFHEGISFRENIEPLGIKVDAVTQEVIGVETNVGVIAARSVLIATGTTPNTILAKEVKGVDILNKYFIKDPVYNFINPKKQQTSIIMKNDVFSLSFFGDLHPEYAGNVVKAMASAKDGYPSIIKLLDQNSYSSSSFSQIVERLDAGLICTIQEVNILAPNIYELVIYSPYAVQNFAPGQFYKLENFTRDISKQMKPLALTGASVDPARGELSLIVLESGVSSDLCKFLVSGERVSLMGPTGTPTEIPTNSTVLLMGGGLGNAVLFSIGAEAKARGNKVLYFAGYRDPENVFKRQEIEAAADQVVWCSQRSKIAPERPQDISFKGNIIEALRWYTQQDQLVKTDNIEHLIVIGSDGMMAATAHAVQHEMQAQFPRLKTAVASINSPMQCMMKEICGQCIQEHIDSKTGEVRYVFSCHTQDQNLADVNWQNLRARLCQNSLPQKVKRK